MTWRAHKSPLFRAAFIGNLVLHSVLFTLKKKKGNKEKIRTYVCTSERYVLEKVKVLGS